MPVDDPVFEKISNEQWLWYAAQVTADDREKFELLRDVAEHNAMFWNPQGVEQVRGAREKSFSVSDKDFGDILEHTFGRRANLPEKSQQGIMHSVPLLQEDRDGKNAQIPVCMAGADPSQFIDDDLDAINFTPFAEEPTNG